MQSRILFYLFAVGFLTQVALAAEPLKVLNNFSAIEYGSSLSADGSVLYYTEAASDFSSERIMLATLKNGQVIEQEPVLFAGESISASEAQLSPDGLKLYFSTRNNFGRLEGRKDSNLYVADWTVSGWSKPKPLPDSINSFAHEYYPMPTRSGNLYFSRQTEAQSLDLFVSEYREAVYQDAQPLPPSFNTELLESDLYVSPDESLMIFVRMHSPGDLGVSDLYISWRKDRQWSAPLHLDRPYNSEGVDGSPYVSLDKKWLYFTSNRESPAPEKFDGHLGIYRIPLETTDIQ
jgi:Tol biopolymer transport system component